MNDSRHTMVQERRDMGKKDIDGGIDLGIGIGIGLDPGPGSPQRMSFFPESRQSQMELLYNQVLRTTEHY